MKRVLLMGGGDLAKEVGAALEAGGAMVDWLDEPDDVAIRAAVETGQFDVACAASREDAFPLRMALLVRELDEDLPIVVTIFDPAMARQVTETIPGCSVTSLADIVAPVLAGQCLDPDIVAVRRTDAGFIGLDRGLEEVPLPEFRVRRARSWAEAVLHPYDRSAALLFYGALGLVAMLLFEWIGSMIVLDQQWVDALYGSTKSLATVGPNPAVEDGPKWFKGAIVASMLLTLLSAACFTSGLINRLVDSSLTGLIGRRAVPRRDHVVVVGLGQVGLRLCLLLRECDVPVVAVDTESEGENVGFARRVKLPVVIGRGANPAMLRRLSLRRAICLAAVTPVDLNNIEAAMAARAADDDLRVLLRAGDGELANETKSLERIGHVVDVHRLGAVFIAGLVLGKSPDAVAVRDGHPQLLLESGWEAFPLDIQR
ncbi:NAD-binding protein [Solirubrobacter sp. CPCC 204708]|uniref:NAD-binding protein n=1 Tax=Solirubrobacter deserti TaxID=2282478 RepID=A0ABT4RLY0_9ACTN|nr:NAD-binding protein [Solirubrobacter deserti]MBE2316734.1 NAD-binding protein [Solirubrobacter deserti]MDA0139490.1 NAD-binding protein [Solirubrobacter deserti]